jgi:hypothetical protein
MSKSTQFIPISMRGRLLVVLFVATCAYAAGYVQGSRRYCLYTAQFQAVDSITREPIDGHVTFSDRMDIFPSPKERMPFIGADTGGVTFDGDHHERALAWFGLRSSAPVTLPIYNSDYVTGQLPLEPLDGGFYKFFNSKIRVIPLTRKQPQERQR